MRFFVHVKPNANEEKVMGTGVNLIVAVRASPREGKANEAMVRVLAAYFNVPKSTISIVAGHTARRKVVEVPVATLGV